MPCLFDSATGGVLNGHLTCWGRGRNGPRNCYKSEFFETAFLAPRAQKLAYLVTMPEQFYNILNVVSSISLQEEDLRVGWSKSWRLGDSVFSSTAAHFTSQTHLILHPTMDQSNAKTTCKARD